jgi:4-diphosphocytidyl-2-C-methyl-D-erythritol kinase
LSNGADAFREAAPAKINLFLHVVGRRPDGKHSIDSLVVFADVGDVVIVSPGTDISLTRSGPMAGDLPPVAEDLVLHAATLLAQTAGVTAGATIEVQKNLPVASGIGGGSADAAAAIRALMRLWRVDLPSEQLSSLARELGADLAVCLANRPSLVRGVGDQLSLPGAIAPLYAVLVNPRSAVSTAEVFEVFDATPYTSASPPVATQEWSSAPHQFAQQLAVCRNDLTDSALTLCSAIGDVLARLDAQPECLLARLSGSGATCLGLFATESTARAAAEALGRDNSDWWVAATQLDTGLNTGDA